MNTNDINTNATIPTCEVCGCCNEELFELAIDGETKLMCADCAESNGYRRCDDCGEWTWEDEGYEVTNGDFICENCRDNGDYTTCEDCGDVVPWDDVLAINAGTRDEFFVCDSCADHYSTCDDCGSRFSDGLLHQDDAGTCICDECYDRRWYTCENCGRLVHTDYVVYRNGCYYCEDCGSDDESNSFHDYSYKPEPEFQFRSSELEKLKLLRGRYISAYEAQADLLTFGVELEVDKGNDHNELCDRLAELDQPIYMKHDGSLGDEGVEIVTHPCSLAYHQYELRWAEIARICKANDYESHDAVTCGLHVHVGRMALGKDRTERSTTAAKLVWLAYRLQNELLNFSRRGESELNRWASFPSLAAPANLVTAGYSLTQTALNTVTDGRYQAVNLCPGATVEFRLFRGTLKRDTIIATLQLVNNLTKYALSHTIEDCALNVTWNDILAVEQFKELNTYSAKRGLL